jgi:hypothetical protein
VTPELSARVRSIMAARLAASEAELKTYREGGLTEEILRRNDGYIKIGQGCAIVVADEAKGAQP